MSAPDRRAMLDRTDKALPLRGPSALLGVARSGVYRGRKPANDNDLEATRRIDVLFTADRFSARAGWWRCCARRACW